MEPVRVTIKGPALATLILTEWLRQHGPAAIEGAERFLDSDGTLDVLNETAEMWVEVPVASVYHLVAESPPVPHKRATSSQTITYLLRLELPELPPG